MAAGTPSGQRLGRPALDAAALIVLVLVALALRALPIAEISLWWDELVHLQQASGDGVRQVLRVVRLGIPPGFGNAGAVPLDYLLLHGWLRIAPEPSPEGVEAYYRAPALLWSVLTVPATYLYVRRFFDRGLALVAGALLALSVPHALYAAEVRFYALFALMTVVNFAAFSSLVERRMRASSWILYTLVALLYFATGMLSLLVLAVQYAILSVLLLVDTARAPGPRSLRDLARLAFPLASGLAVLGAVAYYLRDTLLGARYGRPTEGLGLWERVGVAFEYFAAESWLLLGAFALGVVFLVGREARGGRERVAIVLQIVLCFLVLPAIVEIERWKEYYFHPRHAFFLLPAFTIVAGAGLLLPIRALAPPPRRDAAYVGAALALVVAIQAGPAIGHLAEPERWFARTKSHRDFKSVVHRLRERVDDLAPGEVYLLIAERNRPGHISNPLLARYLEWYGLDDRVLLRGTDDPNETRKAILRQCPDACAGRPAGRVVRGLGLRGPFDNSPQMRDLIGVSPQKPTAAPVGAIGLLHYWRFLGGPPRKAKGFETTTPTGLSFFEKIPARGAPAASVPSPDALGRPGT